MKIILILLTLSLCSCVGTNNDILNVNCTLESLNNSGLLIQIHNSSDYLIQTTLPHHNNHDLDYEYQDPDNPKGFISSFIGGTYIFDGEPKIISLKPNETTSYFIFIENFAEIASNLTFRISIDYWSNETTYTVKSNPITIK